MSKLLRETALWIVDAILGVLLAVVVMDLILSVEVHLHG